MLQDLFITNGYMRGLYHMDFLKYIVPEENKKGAAGGAKARSLRDGEENAFIAAESYLFRNNGNLGFEMSPSNGEWHSFALQWCGYADLDNDGDLTWWSTISSTCFHLAESCGGS